VCGHNPNLDPQEIVWVRTVFGVQTSNKMKVLQARPTSRPNASINNFCCSLAITLIIL